MNTIDMKVSTIIPYYRHGTSIARAVASVWNQTIRPHEIIIVDDGTPEKEAAALKHLAETYPAGALSFAATACRSKVLSPETIYPPWYQPAKGAFWHLL
jgi:glycosyltransferase involved in cell wall biosynthesis